MTQNVYAGFAYVGIANQDVIGTAKPPVAFSRWTAISKGEEVIKDEWIRDGLNIDYDVGIKVMQNHDITFTGELYSDFTARILFALFGIVDSASGTPVGGASTTLSAGVAAGVTTLPVTAITGFATGQIVQIGVTGAAGTELVTIGAPSSLTLPITTPTGGTRYAHLSTAPVVAVADAFTHTGISTNGMPNPITVEHSYAHSGNGPLDVIRTPDCYTNDLKITSDSSKIATAQYTVQGRLGVPGQTAAVVAFETDRPVTLADATFTMADGPASGDITKMELDCKRAQEGVQGAGSLAPFWVPGARDLELDFSYLASDNNFVREAWYGGSSATVPTAALYNIGTVTLLWDVGGSPDHSIQLVLTNVMARALSPLYDVNGKAFIPKVKARIALGSGTSVATVTAVNGYGANYGSGS